MSNDNWIPWETPPNMEDLGKMAEEVYKLRHTVKGLREEADRMEMEIRAGMARLGAGELLHPRFKIELKAPAPNYNDPESKLDLKVLLEEIGQETLESMGAYRPEYLETEPQRIPEKWIGTGLNKVKRLGTKYAELIDSARRPKGLPRLIVEEHKTPTTWHEDTGL